MATANPFISGSNPGAGFAPYGPQLPRTDPSRKPANGGFGGNPWDTGVSQGFWGGAGNSASPTPYMPAGGGQSGGLGAGGMPTNPYAQATAPGYPPGYNASNAPGWNPQAGAPYGSAAGGTAPGFGQPPSQAQIAQNAAMGGGFTSDSARQDAWANQPAMASQYRQPQNSYAGSNGGYYEQQTPLGSFGAANQQMSQGAAPVGQQMAGTAQAANPYIGATTQQIGSAPSVAGSVANLGNADRAGGVGSNAYAGLNNPYLEQSIQQAQDQTTRNFTETMAPQLAQMQRQSGSFGNTGVQNQAGRAYRDLGSSLGNIATSARMADYNQQVGLDESRLSREQQNNQFNAGQSTSDLNRQGQLGLSAATTDANNWLSTQQSNQNANAGDLGRNTNATLGLGTFNAGQQNQGSQFNAGQGNTLGQFNAQLGQNNNQFNAGQGNQTNQFNTGQGNQMIQGALNRNQQQDQFGRTLTNQQNQFNDTLDSNIWNNNQNWANQGQQNNISLLNTIYGLNQQGTNAATNVQNTPLQYLQNFAGIGNGLAGQGGSSSNTQQFDGNMLLGLLGGYQVGNGLFGKSGG